jgi:hypothetical protein
MRNLFDQYSQPENRITHALMTVLDKDRKLLALFLRDLIKIRAPIAPLKLTVLEQQYPGEVAPSEEDLDRRGIPDGWICDEQGWCVVIESKVTAKLDIDQINRHRRTAERLNFERITVAVIAPRFPNSRPEKTVLIEWRAIYSWLHRQRSHSKWADSAARYLEIAEQKLIDTEKFSEGTLTKFSGFPFGRGNSFNYLEGKRLLGLALGELRSRRDLKDSLGMNAEGSGRPAITGRQSDRVWDFLSLSKAAEAETFTKHPHLTLGVLSDAIEATITVPNAVNTTTRRNLKQLGEAGFTKLVEEILNNMKPLLRSHKGATPWFRGMQRRYPSQRATPFIDARIEFDLRTAVLSGGPPKTQPRWLSAAYGAFVNKEHSNYQIQIGVLFRYEQCPELQKDEAIDLIAKAWLACKPLVDLARDRAARSR